MAARIIISLHVQAPSQPTLKSLLLGAICFWDEWQLHHQLRVKVPCWHIQRFILAHFKKKI